MYSSYLVAPHPWDSTTVPITRSQVAMIRPRDSVAETRLVGGRLAELRLLPEPVVSAGETG